MLIRRDENTVKNVMLWFEPGSQPYQDAQEEIMQHLDNDRGVEAIDRIHILGLLNRAQPQQSYDHLKYVLEEE